MDKRTLQKIEKMMSEEQWAFENGCMYDNENDLVKTKLVASLYGTSPSDMENILNDYAKHLQPKQKSMTFDDSYFKGLLNEMMENKGYELEIASMDFKKVLIDTTGTKHLLKVDEIELQTNIINMTNLIRINTGAKITAKDLLTYKDAIMFDQVDKKLQVLLGAVSYNGSNSADNFFTRLHNTLKINEDLDIFQTMMKHFVWQIKRRTAELSTYNDIMIAIFGAQGIGKSYLINAIFGDIFGGFYNASISLDNLLDDRWTRALSTQFLMNIEELDSKGDKLNGQSMGTLKKYLTGTEATYRPMGTNTPKTVKIKSSFISTANLHLSTILSDETGMRRFIEFNSLIPSNTRVNYTEVKWLRDNSLSMFQSIDESKPQGYWDTTNEVGLKVTEIQKSYITNTAYKFLRENFMVDLNIKAKDGLQIMDLYDMYKDHFRSHNSDTKYLVKIDNFKSALERVFDLTEITKKTSGGNKHYLIKPKTNDLKPSFIRFDPMRKSTEGIQ